MPTERNYWIRFSPQTCSAVWPKHEILTKSRIDLCDSRLRCRAA
jgi:hypothetical protein